MFRQYLMQYKGAKKQYGLRVVRAEPPTTGKDESTEEVQGTLTRAHHVQGVLRGVAVPDGNWHVGLHRTVGRTSCHSIRDVS